MKRHLAALLAGLFSLGLHACNGLSGHAPVSRSVIRQMERQNISRAQFDQRLNQARQDNLRSLPKGRSITLPFLLRSNTPCITALATCNLPVAEYTALQMKQAVAGHGLAKKEQVQEMVKRLLNLPSLPGPDAADALGIAITHAHAGHSMAKLAAATELQRSTNGMYKAGRSR